MTTRMQAGAGQVQVVPGRCLHRPGSWMERLSWEGVFGRTAPGGVEVELGSGDGSFLVGWAGRNPGRDFLGVERLLGRIRKLDRKAQRAGLGNVRALRIEAAYCLEYLLPTLGASALHVYFPDPWPKRRHRDNRLVNDRFPVLAAGVVPAGGRVYLRTDHADYFEQMRDVFGRATGWVEEETPGELASVVTDFERAFNAEGIPTLRAAYRRE